VKKQFVLIASCKRRQADGTYYYFPYKRWIYGIGSKTVEFIPGTVEAVPVSALDQQNRFLG
jgi:hypothetical protein